ncbi:HlyD family secretion protein [Serratia marcescens]|jgi:RND family efflux transporter MFP subunit|uniref:Efflux transporter periplasmic adaptor subunit n=1 Tax=Serratia marcescens TaxID=615 RepID=A0AAP8TQN1_SERMA|nr:HlyD family secretion protein [Serratia marcescens]MBH2877769.1 HlyD family secretion protein [Serratia marcescens]PNO70489.1 efflux transporter periplasmic adaptor subunit [Serratia marcescens]QDI18817.1 HlyD family secretion protein [Serratia marcescens]QDI28560.1 HlyD family secretion protein [Serratia marcescens]QDI43066.1 HlyD family secretion protein [Serratia marcescens]
MFRERTLVLLRPALTLIAVLIAAGVLWQLYLYYTYAPQTRDGKIRADVVPLATDVSGKVDAVHIHDNQVVHKGQLLLSLDKVRLRNALDQAEAAVERANVQLASSQRENRRYQALQSAISQQERDNRRDAQSLAKANLDQALADRALARINLQRADLYAPVDGVITNFSLRPGAYATAGQPIMALVDSNSFYIAGYFEETKLGRIQNGDKVVIRIMGERQPLYGHVDGLSAGINDSERTTAAGNLLANVNPTFSWIRLAQRIPVRIAIDTIPHGVELIAGRTATVSLKDNGE